MFSKENNSQFQKNKDFNDELINRAKNTNLADYFSRNGYTVQKHGREAYVAEIKGLCIDTSNNSWFHHYTNRGGHNSIDCLTKVCDLDFKTAVQDLTGQSFVYGNKNTNKKENPKTENKNQTAVANNSENKIENQPKKEKELVMPERCENMRKTFAYFIQTRKIPAEIVSELAKSGLLYQSQQEFTATVKGVEQNFVANNAVFVHKDGEKIVGAEIQGLNTFKRYKGIASGTQDSTFNFVPYPAKDGKIKKAYLFESAIDLMSFYAFCDKKKLDGVALISMAGLKPAVPKKLQSEGVEVFSCVDNDEAGRAFEKENGFQRAGGKILEEANVKDWNEYLVLKTANKTDKQGDVLKSEPQKQTQEQQTKKHFARSGS
jgi:hypothetical protein